MPTALSILRGTAHTWVLSQWVCTLPLGGTDAGGIQAKDVLTGLWPTTTKNTTNTTTSLQLLHRRRTLPGTWTSYQGRLQLHHQHRVQNTPILAHPCKHPLMHLRLQPLRLTQRYALQVHQHIRMHRQPPVTATGALQKTQTQAWQTGLTRRASLLLATVLRQYCQSLQRLQHLRACHQMQPHHNTYVRALTILWTTRCWRTHKNPTSSA